MGIGVVAKNHLQKPSTMFLQQFWKLRSKSSRSFIRFMYAYPIRMYSYAIRMSLVCYPYVTRMYSYVIRMSLVCSFTMNLLHLIWALVNLQNMPIYYPSGKYKLSICSFSPLRKMFGWRMIQMCKKIFQPWI